MTNQTYITLRFGTGTIRELGPFHTSEIITAILTATIVKFGVLPTLERTRQELVYKVKDHFYGSEREVVTGDALFVDRYTFNLPAEPLERPIDSWLGGL